MDDAKVNATQAFLGHEPEWRAARVELNDVHGLWGGRRIHVQGSQRAVVQLVRPGMLEHRYEFELDAHEWKALLEIFVGNDFLTIEPVERPGIPDEARPSITLVNSAGERCVVAKWAGVEDGRFDAVYSAVAGLEGLTGRREPVYTGPHGIGKG